MLIQLSYNDDETAWLSPKMCEIKTLGRIVNQKY